MLMLSSKKLDGVEWDSLSLVVNFSKGQRTCSGFVYSTEVKDFNSWTPGSIPFIEKMEEFREAMIAGGDRPWETTLIQITKPDINFTIDIEYDDPLRWELEGKSLSLSEYANSLRPK